jgi:dynein heavy chain
MIKLENEIRKNYDFASRKILLDYIMMDPDELKRIGITNYYRPDYSSMLIRGPVPWHHMTIINKERLIHNLYIFRESILKLDKVWKK